MRRIILPHKVGHGLAVVLKRLVHHLDVLTHKAPINEVQHRKAGLGSAAEAYRVSVGKGRGNNSLFIRQPLYRAQPVAQLGGALVLHPLAGGDHFLLQLKHQLPAVAVEEGHHPL